MSEPISSEPITSKSGIQEFYDDPGVVGSYITMRISEPFNTVLHERQVGFLNGVIGELRPRRVLEVAVGPGRLSAEVRAASVMIGMDGSPNMLAEARRRTRARGLGWNFVRGDGFSLPFATGSFDLIYTLRFIRHFDRSGRETLYRELRRTLRPGGHRAYVALWQSEFAQAHPGRRRSAGTRSSRRSRRRSRRRCARRHRPGHRLLRATRSPRARATSRAFLHRSDGAILHSCMPPPEAGDWVTCEPGPNSAFFYLTSHH